MYRKDFSAGSSARWEQYFLCFRYYRFSLFTEREKIVEKDVKHVRRTARLRSDFRRMVPGRSAVTASSVRSVSTSVHRSTFTVESGNSKEMSWVYDSACTDPAWHLPVAGAVTSALFQK